MGGDGCGAEAASELRSAPTPIYPNSQMINDVLNLMQSLYCLPRPGDTDDPLLAAGTPVRDLWRGDDYGELGFSWRFLATFDGGET